MCETVRRSGAGEGAYRSDSSIFLRTGGWGVEHIKGETKWKKFARPEAADKKKI